MALLCRHMVARIGRLGKRTTLLSLPLADLAIWRLPMPTPAQVVGSLAEAPTCYYLQFSADEAVRLCDLLLCVVAPQDEMP